MPPTFTVFRTLYGPAFGAWASVIEATAARTTIRIRKLFRMAASPLEFSALRFDRNLHLSVRPAALKAAATFSGVIIRDNVKDIFAGLRERGGSRRFAGERDARAFDFFDHGPLR